MTKAATVHASTCRGHVALFLSVGERRGEGPDPTAFQRVAFEKLLKTPSPKQNFLKSWLLSLVPPASQQGTALSTGCPFSCLTRARRIHRRTARSSHFRFSSLPSSQAPGGISAEAGEPLGPDLCPLVPRQGQLSRR